MVSKCFRNLWSLIPKAFSHVDAKTFRTLYTMFVRHKLENCIQEVSSKKRQRTVRKGLKNRKQVDTRNPKAPM